MRNMLTIVLVVVAAILGFFAYQSSQKGNALQADLAARTEAVTALETEKLKLTEEIAALKAQGEAAGMAANDAAASVQADAAAMLEKVSTLETEKADLAAQVAALEADAAKAAESAQAQIATLTETVTSLEAEKAALQAQVDVLTAAAPANP